MPVDGVNTTTAANNPWAAPVKGDEDQFGKDTFLKLLVAQLKYQDPLKPSDPQSFLSQTAQFTSVEKMSEMADQLTASSRTAALSTGIGLVGRVITYAGDDGAESFGIVGSASPTADGIVLKVGNHETTIDKIISVH